MTAAIESTVEIVGRERERIRNRVAERPALHPSLLPPRRRSAVHVLILGLVWLTIFSGFFVRTEPAPFDALMMGVVLLLPVVGLSRIGLPHLAYLFLWLAITAAELLAATFAEDVGAASMHTIVSLYLCLASFVMATFVARNPVAHTRLVANAYVASAVVAAIMGIVGYLDLFPGAAGLLTLHSRAVGAFKDPNVFAAFLLPAMFILFHDALTRRFMGIVVACTGLAIVGLALLMSFSRGAWGSFAIGILVYAWLAFVTARTDRQRLKLVALALLGLVMSAGLIAMALEIDDVAKLFEMRASFGQSYDLGPEGRFGGQVRAIAMILENPLGIGALQFGGVYHPEHPHNIYVSMFLNAGWIGGFLYIALIALLLVLGWRAVRRRSWASPLLLAIYAAFIALVVEGFVVETDHWRHFYVISGVLFGLSVQPAAERGRGPRIVKILPASMTAVPVVPSTIVVPRPRHRVDVAISEGRKSRRASRIVARVEPGSPIIVPEWPPARRRRRRRQPRRSPRIVSLALNGNAYRHA